MSAFSNAIRAMTLREPFEPIAIGTSDGRSFVVRHPELVVVPTVAPHVIVYQPDGHMTFLNPQQIVSVEPSRSRPKPRTKRRKS